MAFMSRKTKLINHPSQIINNTDNLNCEDGTKILGCAALEDQKLQDVMSILAPLSSNLKNSFIVFSNYGMMIHTSVCEEQIYIPISKNQFSSYRWDYEDPAVFLVNVDSNKGLLDIFKPVKDEVSKVMFEVSNPSPVRMLNQTIFTLKDNILRCTTLIKAEFSNYSIMLPSRVPDLSLELNRHQLNKILGLNKRSNSKLIFESSMSNIVTISSENGTVILNLNLDDQETTSASILKSSTKKTKDNCLVKHSGSPQVFKISLQDHTNFFPLLRKIKLTDTAVSINFFFTPSDNPMISLTTSKPIGAMMFFFCTNDIHNSTQTTFLEENPRKRFGSTIESNEPSKIPRGLFKQYFVHLDNTKS
ncbi:DNA polymerase processivity subunit-like protein [Phocid alphaherpesvirus 1]|uniref:DNA polymerase processivity factor n=1 Tax=Phocid alphaherpesvirus 1 TaxID=47418 RepID=A0A482F755_9ALPH|nr:DNA polymerase processivity subunit-like protein [Phocid alphaherpesvirus 1]QBN85161.1 DNA polymerase processivity subunit-like protein [Phocid alphaherpesvirus 1]UNP64239.1 DNA polymerase processivity subunit-like protein [Phocid alphaherpesvirus 1]